MGRPRSKPLVILDEVPAANSGVRGLLAQVLEEDATLDGIRAAVMDAIGAETVRPVVCPDCRSKFRAPVPDVKKQVDAIISLLEQNEGKATERPPDALTVIIERPPLR